MYKVLIVLIFVFVNSLLFSQVSIHIASLSDNTPEGADIFFAGNINGWNPGDASYMLEIRDDGDYWIDISEGTGTVEFKFTRGNWDSVESNGNGGFRPNRTFTYGTVDTLHLSILGWEDLDNGGSSESTANDQVQVWNESMEMPQLNRNRRVWVYLPKDYEAEPEKRYPVLYMHDGQNVFDASTSFAGEWKVDETLTSMEEEGYYGLIVVAIDNGGSHRIDEYSPFVNTLYGGGEGDAYLDFIIETLKPAIDSNFRTMTGPNYTGMIGSSMGGLISHYAHFRNPEIFRRAGIFSPSYWFSDQYYTYTANAGKTDSARLYILAGAKESTIALGAQQMYDQLVQMGYETNEIQLEIDPDGEHSEWFWAREFEHIVKWLFPNDMVNNDLLYSLPVKIYPNPGNGTFIIEGKGKMEVNIFSIEGKLIDKYSIIDRGTINLKSDINSPAVLVQVFQKGVIKTEKIIVINH